MHASAYEQLAQFFRDLADIPETEIAKAMKIFQPTSVRKGESSSPLTALRAFLYSRLYAIKFPKLCQSNCGMWDSTRKNRPRSGKKSKKDFASSSIFWEPS